MQEIVPETEKWSTNSPKPTTSKPFIFPFKFMLWSYPEVVNVVC